MRYIDADLLKDKTTRVNNIWNGTTNAEGKGLDEIIDDIPTADVVEVVRCKDCKYHAEFSSKCNKLHLTPMLPNYYCSYGERREMR